MLHVTHQFYALSRKNKYFSLFERIEILKYFNNLEDSYDVFRLPSFFIRVFLLLFHYLYSDLFIF